MNIGVIVKGFDPKAGGAFGYKQSILSEISRIASDFQLIILDIEANTSENKTLSCFKHINIWEDYRARDNPAITNQSKLAALSSVLAHFLKAILRSGLKRNSNPPKVTASDALTYVIKNHDISLAWFIDPVAGDIPVPHFCTVWDLQHRIQPWFPEVSSENNTWRKREDMYNFMLKKASLIIAGTQEGKNEISHFYGVHRNNIEVIPLPVTFLQEKYKRSECKELKARYELEDDFLFYPAQFWAHKNHVNLLLALIELKKRWGSSPQLILSGSDQGNLYHIEQKVQLLGLSDQVKMIGFVPEEDLSGLYALAACLVFVSYFGPDNIPPLEAFSLDCPVVAANIPGASEQLEDAALLVDPNSPLEIATAIWKIQSTPDLRKTLIENGRRVVRSRSASEYAHKMIEHFNQFQSISVNWR